jgi:hypothetical protein
MGYGSWAGLLRPGPLAVGCLGRASGARAETAVGPSRGRSGQARPRPVGQFGVRAGVRACLRERTVEREKFGRRRAILRRCAPESSPEKCFGQSFTTTKARRPTLRTGGLGRGHLDGSRWRKRCQFVAGGGTRRGEKRAAPPLYGKGANLQEKEAWSLFNTRHDGR